MTKQKFLLAVTALVLGFGVMPMMAQEREQRRDIERRLGDLRDEMRQLERELGDLGGGNRFFRGLVTFSTNRAQLGVFVQTEADPATDDVGALLQSVNEQPTGFPNELKKAVPEPLLGNGSMGMKK